MSLTVALLPFATPCEGFKTWSVFHPAAIPSGRRSKKGLELDENKDYTGFSSVKMASSISHIMMATIPPKATIPGMMLDQLLSTYVDPENILAEIERVEHSGETIASQVERAFEIYQGINSVTVIWPYQIFREDDQAVLGKGDAAFAYHHPMLSHAIEKVPEAIGLWTEGTQETECVCKDVAAYSTLDPILKGQYTTTLSMVEIKRDDFEEFRASQDYPNLVALLRKTIVGKRGVLVNPTGSGFIGA